MSNKLILKSVDLYIRFYARLHPLDSIVDIFSTIERANQVLVYLPDNLEDFGVARLFVAEIRKYFSQTRLTFIIRNNYLTLLEPEDRKASDFLLLKPDQTNSFGLPGKQLAAEIKNFRCDVFIDFTHEFSLFSTFLNYLSGAPLRICLSDPKRDSFFNFQIEVGKDTKLENKYRKLINYISFRKSPTLV